MQFKQVKAALVIAATLAMGQAHAGLVTTDLNNGVALNFASHPVQELTSGPVALSASDGSRVVYSGSNPDGSVGFSAEAYGLGSNGTWYGADQSYLWANGDDSGGYLTRLRLTFESGPVSSVGGFMNYHYVLGESDRRYDSNSVFVRAIGSAGQTLEEYRLEQFAPIRTPVTWTDPSLNQGAFRGIERESADIYAFEIGGPAVLRDLRFSPSVSPVPLPAAAWLLACGLPMLLVRRKRAPSVEA